MIGQRGLLLTFQKSEAFRRSAKASPQMAASSAVWAPGRGSFPWLDALIGNQDRHHKNWGLLKVAGGGLALAPTFDHASSLGRNESDEVRTERLATRDSGRSVAAYVLRARSGLYKTKTSKKAMTTMDAFRNAAAWHPAAAGYWRQRLDALDPAALEAIILGLPTSAATETARRFALQVMLENRARLLESE